MRIDLNKEDGKNLKSFLDESHAHYLNKILSETARKQHLQKRVKQVLPVIAIVDNYGTIYEKYQELLTL